MSEAPIERVRAVKFEADRGAAESIEWVSVEEPLEIRVESPSQSDPVRVAVTMRTPGHEQELAVGFLCTEGIISSRDDLARPSVRELVAQAARSNVITVRLARAFDATSLQRNFYATSSCGVCGKASIDQVERSLPRITSATTVARSTIESLPARLRAAQTQFDQTGGLHGVAVFSLRTGALVCAREDVGRHNAMDKAVGRLLLDGALPLSDCAVMVSGRSSFELVQKVAAAGAPVLCAVSAPTSLAIDAARRFGVTLVGFVREDRCTVYAHAERVIEG
jgi:FdhD protein